MLLQLVIALFILSRFSSSLPFTALFNTTMAGNISDAEFLTRLKEETANLLNDAYQTLGARTMRTVRASNFSSMPKDIMTEVLHQALSVLEDFTMILAPDFETARNCVKNQMFDAQNTIIKLQSELLVSRNEQLESFKAAVSSSVGKTVETEFQTYSSALLKNLPPPTPAVTTEELKNTVKNVLKEEDRSRNVMIFNLPEQENEEINAVVAEVFKSIGEKPRVEASRLGKRSNKSPVKVTVTNSAVVSQILSKARNLRKINEFKSVFVCPDRSTEQRAKQKLLVADLKRLTREQTDKKHFIRDGKILSVQKK